ncbi:MAG: hypothetical protein R3331_05175 [Sulfurospirillaceae bacterium]|nr:hypothetical protein [Sulfurospirillaceae bacterium]
MKNHKVIDIKITYQPENMENVQSLEEKVEKFLESIKGTKGVKIKAKKHNVAVDIMLDEYGMELEE